MQETEQILSELEALQRRIDPRQTEALLDLIGQSGHIYLAGAGRSGLMIRAFANRLMHLGYPVSVVGELSAPHTHPGDLLIVGTGSGSSPALLHLAKTACGGGVSLAVITANAASPLAQMAQAVVQIPAQTKQSAQEDLQPMGSLFEQASLLLYDSLILQLMARRGETAATMKSRHADLE